jgi:hypothetical protein
MTSRARRSFWQLFSALPPHVQRQARVRFALWRREPSHPSLHFKELRDGLWSVRVNRSYRALALREGDLVVWFWIGPHGEYDRLIDQA